MTDTIHGYFIEINIKKINGRFFWINVVLIISKRAVGKQNR